MKKNLDPDPGYLQVTGVTGIWDCLCLRAWLCGFLPSLHRNDGSFDYVLQWDKYIVVFESIGREALWMKLPKRIFHHISPKAVEHAGPNCVCDMGWQLERFGCEVLINRRLVENDTWCQKVQDGDQHNSKQFACCLHET